MKNKFLKRLTLSGPGQLFLIKITNKYGNILNFENNKTKKMKLNKSKIFIGRFNLCDREVTINKYP